MEESSISIDKSENFFDDLISGENSKYQYIGWIPNTTGHVYFRHATIKKARGVDSYLARPPYLKEIAEKAEKDDVNEVRYILATSLENLNDDIPGPEDIIYTRFVVSAKSVNKKILRGDLWMIWNIGEKKIRPY